MVLSGFAFRLRFLRNELHELLGVNAIEKIPKDEA
jgi:hypothetical protein